MIENRKTAVTYQGDGNTSVFPFSFDISSVDTIRVAIYDMATEATTEITRDYFVDASAKVVHYPGYAPGQAPAAAAQPPKLPRGKNITIYRVTPIDQLTDLGNKYPLPYIETMADKLTAILQEHDEMFGRTVTLPAGDPKTPEQRLTDLQAYVLDAKNAASAADQSARSAGDSKAFVASSASSAAQSAAASEVSRQASAVSESNIKNMQVDVHATQSHVDEVKTAIDGVAAQAKADRLTASDAALQAQNSAETSVQSAAASEASAKRAEAAARFDGVVESENLAEKSVHKKHLHPDAYESPALTGTPTAPTAGRGTNNEQIASTAFVAQAIAALVNSAPGALDTLQELASALGNDANFATTVTNALAGKLGKTETAARATELIGWSLERNRAYSVGDVAYHRSLPSWARLECVKAGTTAGSLPSLAAINRCGVMVTDGSVVWIVDDLRDGTPVGVVRGSLYVPAGYVKANGATVQRADYPRLVALADRYSLWTSAVPRDPGLFGRADHSTTMTLPNWIDRMVQLSECNNGTEYGKGIGAGLPNIEGYITSTSGYGLWWGADGGVEENQKEEYNPSNSAIQLTNEVRRGHKADSSPYPATKNPTVNNNTIRFNAALNNPIYGRSNTVQPAAIQLFPIIKY